MFIQIIRFMPTSFFNILRISEICLKKKKILQSSKNKKSLKKKKILFTTKSTFKFPRNFILKFPILIYAWLVLISRVIQNNNKENNQIIYTTTNNQHFFSFRLFFTLLSFFFVLYKCFIYFFIYLMQFLFI